MSASAMTPDQLRIACEALFAEFFDRHADLPYAPSGLPYRAVRLLSEALGMVPQWLPIESAPKDGRTVYVARHGGDSFGWIMGTAHWVQGSIAEGWIARGTGVYGELGLAHPTHWMPLPCPPTKQQEGS